MLASDLPLFSFFFQGLDASIMSRDITLFSIFFFRGWMLARDLPDYSVEIAVYQACKNAATSVGIPVHLSHTHTHAHTHTHTHTHSQTHTNTHTMKDTCPIQPTCS